MIGIPDSKTTAAASGSTRILNSAAGVQLPYCTPPPIREIRAIFSFSSGYAISNAATFVKGPVGTRVMGSSLSWISFAISVTASISSSSKSGSGNAGPSRPLSPCTVGAIMGSEISGLSRPIAVGTCKSINVQIRCALYVVFSMV